MTTQIQSAMQAVKRVTMTVLVLAELKKPVNLASAVEQAARFATQKVYKTILLIRPQPSGLVSSTPADTAI